MVILISYVIKTSKTMQLRNCINKTIKSYVKNVYIIDNERIANESLVNDNYFYKLKFGFDLTKESKRDFYQKITDMYATSFDYNGFSNFTRSLYIDVINSRNKNNKKQYKIV